jgi:hypothetical protein
MRLTTSRCIVTGLEIREISIRRAETLPAMDAKYALLGVLSDFTGKVTYGKPKIPEACRILAHGLVTAVPENWSTDTIKLLQALIESMESDLLPQHFEEDRDVRTDEGLESGTVEETEQL